MWLRLQQRLTTAMRVKDYVSGNIEYHSELCPLAWQDHDLLTEVNVHLLRTARTFISYLEIPDFKIQDIVLTGSMANYNWTKYSDFDVHVITRYSDLRCDDLAAVFYKAKKKIWNSEHDVTIHGHEVEMYVEDVGHAAISAGMFSLLRNQWIVRPDRSKPRIDRRAINHKVSDLITQITASMDSGHTGDIKRVIDKIRKMRKSGLSSGGEQSTENLAFKILRNQGYISKLNTTYLSSQDRELSL
jgi:hypothetical protein